MSQDDRRQPALTAPWPALLLTFGLIALYAWQRTAGDQEALYYAYGLTAPAEGWRLLSSLFVHGGWAHVILNAVGGLAFGAAVARLFGTGVPGALAFFLFYLVCGAFSGWACVEIRSGGPVLLIGASGAVSGLMGGASRLLGPPVEGRRLAAFTSPAVIGMAAAWIILNLLIAGLGFAPGMGETPVGWEAHLAGYAAGLLLIGPFAWVLGRLRGAPTHGDIDSRA